MRSTAMVGLILLAFPWLAASAGETPALPVELLLREPAGVARPAWPVTSGVPLPAGAVKEPGELVLKDAAGQPVPCQFETLARWPDGSVKWVELNLQADLAAGAEARFTLGKGAGTAAAPGKPVKVSETAAAVTVDTGAISFTVPKKQGSIIGELSAGGKPVLAGRGLAVVGARDAAKGVDFSTLRGKVEKVEVERAGPMIARVYLVLTCSGPDGKPFIPVADSKKKYAVDSEDFFKVRVRISAYAGRPFVCVVPALTHSGPMDDSVNALFQSAALRFEPAAPLAEAAAEGVSGPVAGQGFTLLQCLGAKNRDYAVRMNKGDRPAPYFQVQAGGAEKKKGVRAMGSLIASGPAGRLGLAVRRFYEYAPTAIAAREKELAVELPPADPGQDLHALHAGRQRSREVLLAAAADPLDKLGALSKVEGPAGDLAAFLAPRLVLTAPPAWYADLEVFGLTAEEALAPAGYPPEQHKAICDLEVAIKQLVDARTARTKQSVFDCMYPGWLDYGDLPWSAGWCNLHYDWTMGMLLQFLRTGRREFFDAADAMAWHRQDIAQNHSGVCGAVEPRRQWSRHLTYYEKDDHRSTGQSPKPSHTWNRGMAYWHLVTGDPMAREVAVSTAEGLRGWYAAARLIEGKAKASDPDAELRMQGWTIENFLGAYELTSDRKYLDWALALFRSSYQTLCDGRKVESAAHMWPLMYGYSSEPLCRLHYYTKDAKVLETLRYLADEAVIKRFLLGGRKDAAGNYQPYGAPYGWKREDWEAGKAVKTEGPWNLFWPNLLAYLHMQTGEEKYRDLARAVFRDAVTYTVKPGGGISRGHGTKTNGWLLRFNQIYLYMEKQLAKGARFPSK